jgi:hypothetical protein
MVLHHIVYHMVLFVLIWLVIILHLIWSKPGVSAPVTPAEPEPLKPKRPRSNASKPSEGLTQKPHCALYERDALHPKALCCGILRIAGRSGRHEPAQGISGQA